MGQKYGRIAFKIKHKLIPEMIAKKKNRDHAIVIRYGLHNQVQDEVLMRLHQSLNSDIYVEDTMLCVVLLFLQQEERESRRIVFQQDNACLHQAIKMKHFLEKHNTDEINDLESSFSRY